MTQYRSITETNPETTVRELDDPGWNRFESLYILGEGGWGERGEVLFNIHFKMPIESPIALYGY